ncbi:MAG TPA: hypothetical protein VM285_10450, partial [Polyangia bacterium]|nr:hypothetical protein [Polyangia bacterium]
GAGWYVCAPNGPASLAFSLALAEIDVWHSSLVWVKNSLVLGRGDYHYRHEQMFYGWTPGAPGAGTRPSGRASCASRNNVVGAKPGAFGAGTGLETGFSEHEEGRSGRGERDSPATNDLPITMRLAEPPEPVELVRSA